MIRRTAQNSGFTLAEALIVLAILGLLSGSLVFNYRQSETRDEVETAARLLEASLRRAQAAALGGQTYNGNTMSDYRLILSSQTGENTSYRLCAASVACTTNVVETESLPRNVLVRQVVAGNVSSIPNPIDSEWGEVVFSLPYGDISFSKEGGIALETSLNIIISDSAGDYYKIVTVDRVSGSIRIWEL